jgi:hypothetical protein
MMRWFWGILVREKPPHIRLKTRRRRLLEASRWRSTKVNIRDHVRAIERVLAERSKTTTKR